LTRAEVEAIALALPAATQVVLFRGKTDVYKVGGKVFASCGDDQGLSFKATEIAYAVLTEEGRGRRAPGFMPGGWVNLPLAALEPDETAGWLATSHRLAAANLTRKARTELSL
jgi:predicted DNA-binding protein (MmcQ/YjbR family)